jgi:hypothetical protein
MKSFIIILICLMFATPSLAAKETTKKKTEKKPESAAELTVPEKECEYLTAYQPSADTEYQPGVDVHGKPVMEADLTPSVIKPPEKYSFDITVDVAKFLGRTVPAGLMGEAKMGTITVEKGQVKFNGDPLEGDEVATLKALCAAQKAKKAPK